MRLIFIIILFLTSFFTFAQPQEGAMYNVDAETFSMDKLGNFYFIDNNILTKTDAKMQTLYTYDNNSYGNLDFVDTSDPLRIMLFYKNFNTLIYLDKNLAELRDPISLDDLNFYSVDVVSVSQNGGFWLYDNQNSRIVELNKNLDVIQQGMNIYSIIGNENISCLKVSTNYIVLFATNGELIVLDKFANFYKKLHIKKDALIDLDNNNLYVLDKDLLTSFNLDTGLSKDTKLNVSEAKAISVSGNTIFVLTDKSLITFKNL